MLAKVGYDVRPLSLRLATEQSYTHDCVIIERSWKRPCGCGDLLTIARGREGSKV